MPAPHPTYDIEGEALTFRQIRERVPSSIKDCTLSARLTVYKRRTWAALCETPHHRPRPEQRAQPNREPARRVVLPAWREVY